MNNLYAKYAEALQKEVASESQEALERLKNMSGNPYKYVADPQAPDKYKGYRTSVSQVYGGGRQQGAERLGDLTNIASSLLAGAVIGAGVGALKSNVKSRGVSVGVGALVGGAYGTIIGALSAAPGAALAAVTPTRTDEEQEKYERGSSLMNYTVPGVASYNYWKSVGNAKSLEDRLRAK